MKKILCVSLLFLTLLSFTKRVYSQNLYEYALLMGAFQTESPNQMMNSDCQNLRNIEIAEINYYFLFGTYTNDLNDLVFYNYVFIPNNITVYLDSSSNCSSYYYYIISVAEQNSPNYFAVLPFFTNYVSNTQGGPLPPPITFDSNGNPITPSGYTITTDCPHCAITAYADTIKSCNKKTFVKDTLIVQGKISTQSLVINNFNGIATDKLAVIKTDGSIDTTNLINSQTTKVKIIF